MKNEDARISKLKYMVLIIVLTGGCLLQPPSQKSQVEGILASLKGLPIDDFFEESFKQLLLRDPQTITQLGIAEQFGLRNDQLNNISDAYIRETQQLQSGILELLGTYDRNGLTPEQKLSYDVYEWYLDDLVRGHEFMYYNYPVHHFLGSYHDELILFLTETHTVESKEDAEDYVSRLSQVDTQVDQLLEGLKIREELGIIPPRFILDYTRRNMISYFQSPPGMADAKSLTVYTVFREKLEKLSLNEKEKQELLDKALKEIEESFIPAYVNLFDRVDYLGSVATDDAGVWKFPKGDEYYTYLLRRETSTELTAEEIHQMGLAEVERIQEEMRAVFSELGYPEDELCNLVNRAITEGGFYDTGTQQGKDEVVAAYEELLREVNTKLDEVVDIHPEADVIIFGDPTYGGGGGYYVSASLDGSRPGAFHTGIADSFVYKYMMPTVLYHEAVPGHHFQLAIAQEMDLPLFRNVVFSNGFAEGWALYAEKLAWELGLYEDNPYGNIGRLHFELLRAVRLVTDTGIHAKKWGREEAKAYMDSVLGKMPSYSSEVDRYIVLPGQATGYKVGMMKILELRERARNELGDRFDLKEFHRVVLGNGCVPLDILERIVQDYIDAKLGKSGEIFCITVVRLVVAFEIMVDADLMLDAIRKG